MEDLSSELAELAGAEAKLNLLRPEAAGLEAAEGRVPRLRTVLEAAKELAAQPEVQAPPRVDETALAAAEQAALAARSELGSAEARRQSAAGELKSAKEARARSSSLSGTEDCPLCGQPLGDAFASVQAHREQELEAAQSRLVISERAFAGATKSAEEALAVLKRAGDEATAARQKQAAYEQARAAREAASKRLATASDALADGDEALVLVVGPTPDLKKLARVLDDAVKGLCGGEAGG